MKFEVFNLKFQTLWDENGTEILGFLRGYPVSRTFGPTESAHFFGPKVYCDYLG